MAYIMNNEALMGAEPQPKGAQERKSRSQRHSTETRLAIVETRWEDVIPTLATKVDIAEIKTGLAKLQAEVLIIRKDMEAMEQQLNARMDAMEQQSDARMVAMEQRLNARMDAMDARMDAMMNKIIFRLTSIIVAAIGVTATIATLIQKFL